MLGYVIGFNLILKVALQMKVRHLEPACHAKRANHDVLRCGLFSQPLQGKESDGTVKKQIKSAFSGVLTTVVLKVLQGAVVSTICPFSLCLGLSPALALHSATRSSLSIRPLSRAHSHVLRRCLACLLAWSGVHVASHRLRLVRLHSATPLPLSSPRACL